MNNIELVNIAREMRERAYAPYSHFAVGAALLCSDGEVFTGCNVEGASYSNAICAERTALVKAVSCGKRSFAKLAVSGNGKKFCTPCGICRQMLYEFSPELIILCANEDGEYEEHSMKELLPYAFGPEMVTGENTGTVD
ncbi:MAG: cytidine deaminase [Clostridiales bacterium]|nr:cytidine deaminase [Clostridiales bacterium]